MSVPFDELIVALARRVIDAPPSPPEALPGARLELIDALAALFEAQQAGPPAACLGPLLPGATWGGGARVPGSSLELEPSQAAYCLGWLSGDARVGALLALGDYLARRAVLTGQKPPRVITLLEALLQARALAHAVRLPEPYDGLPLAAPLATRVAVAGLAARWLGGDQDAVAAALSLAFAEGLAPHDGHLARACAAAAWSGVRVALLAHNGAPPMPRVLSNRPAGFEAALLGGRPVTLAPEGQAPLAPAHEELSTWHRFEQAVQQRFPARQATKVLAAVNAAAPLEAMPLQAFVARLVRPA